MEVLDMELDPNTVYVRESLYIPKKNVKLSIVSTSLTFVHGDKIFTHYEELSHHYRIPRHFLSSDKFMGKIPFIDLRPTKYPKIEIKSKIKPNTQLQKDSLMAIHNKSGILSIPCGAGKTVIALEEIARRKQPTLIVVNTEQILNQWKNRIAQFLDVKKIGIIQQDVFDWKAPITIAMIQTLAKRRDMITEQIRKFYGLVIWDEVDETATPVYSQTCDIFYGDRLGLTATPVRRDGLEKIFQYHMGPILLFNNDFVLTPKIVFVKSTLVIPPTLYTNFYSNNINYGKLYTMISQNTDRNELIIRLISKKLKEGRKILVLGERKEQLKKLYSLFDETGLCTGLCIAEVDVETRTQMLKECQLIFAIRKLSKRALDQQDLDTLICLYPMSDPGGIQQAAGRILRVMEDKAVPEIFIIEDVNLPPMEHTCLEMRKVFSDWDFDISNMNI